MADLEKKEVEEVKEVEMKENNFTGCAFHPNNKAIGTCVGCGKFICDDCTIELQGKNYCKECANKAFEEKTNNANPMVFMNSSSAASAANNGMNYHLKSRTTAIVLALFLGGIGGHKFYLGQPIFGILYLMFCWTFIPSIIAVLECIIYIATSEQAFAKKYSARF